MSAKDFQTHFSASAAHGQLAVGKSIAGATLTAPVDPCTIPNALHRHQHVGEKICVGKKFNFPIQNNI